MIVGKRSNRLIIINSRYVPAIVDIANGIVIRNSINSCICIIGNSRSRRGVFYLCYRATIGDRIKSCGALLNDFSDTPAILISNPACECAIIRQSPYISRARICEVK